MKEKPAYKKVLYEVNESYKDNYSCNNSLNKYMTSYNNKNLSF